MTTVVEHLYRSNQKTITITVTFHRGDGNAEYKVVHKLRLVHCAT
jgi:hypothetical protein